MKTDFTCEQCGVCCKQRGDYQYLYVNANDIVKIAQFLGLTTDEFVQRYVKNLKHGSVIRFANRLCPFFTENGCSIHSAKPAQCLSWPFWSENMDKDIFKKNITKICSGAKQYNAFMRDAEK